MDDDDAAEEGDDAWPLHVEGRAEVGAQAGERDGGVEGIEL